MAQKFLVRLADGYAVAVRSVAHGKDGLVAYEVGDKQKARRFPLWFAQAVARRNGGEVVSDSDGAVASAPAKAAAPKKKAAKSK